MVPSASGSLRWVATKPPCARLIVISLTFEPDFLADFFLLDFFSFSAISDVFNFLDYWGQQNISRGYTPRTKMRIEDGSASPFKSQSDEVTTEKFVAGAPVSVGEDADDGAKVVLLSVLLDRPTECFVYAGSREPYFTVKVCVIKRAKRYAV